MNSSLSGETKDTGVGKAGVRHGHQDPNVVPTPSQAVSHAESPGPMGSGEVTPHREKEPVSLCQPGEQTGSPHGRCAPAVSPGSAPWHQCGRCLRTNCPQGHGAGWHGSRPRPEASPLPQVVADGRLVEPFALIQELGDVSTRVLQQVVLY